MSNRIACSPLTGRIFAGRVNRAGNAFTGEKRDVTSDVLRAVIEKADYHGGAFDIEGGGERYIVIVTKRPDVAVCTCDAKDMPFGRCCKATPSPAASGSTGLADEDIEAIAERLEASDPTSAFWKEFARAVLSSAGASPNAARYELLRRGQHWSVVNGIGDHLRADELDAAIEQEDRAAEKIEIRYERVGRCFWHIGCQAQRHSPPMRLASFKEQDKPATAMFCTACGEGGWYPHGRVGNVCCERIAKATP